MLPIPLVPLMKRYLDVHRPVLLGTAVPALPLSGEKTTALWITRSAKPLPADSFADMISRRTLAQFGVRLTPHSFRHAAATTIAQNRPEEALIIRLILGHSTTTTAEQHYIHATRINAANRYQGVVESLRAPREARARHDARVE